MKTRSIKRQLSGNSDATEEVSTPLSLSSDIITKIFSELGPHKKAKITASSSHLDRLFNSSAAWIERFKRHFPHLLASLQHKFRPDYEAEFNAATQHEYHQLSEHHQKIFYRVKENNLEKLSKMNLTAEDLFASDINNCMVLDWALQKGNQAILDLFYSVIQTDFILKSDNGVVSRDQLDSSGCNLLHRAIICRQSPGVIQALISTYAFNMNAKSTSGYTPLLFSLCAQSSRLLNLLISHGASVAVTDNDGRSPLNYSAAIGDDPRVTILLQNGADINASPENNGMTALWEAACNGHASTVKLLLANHANPAITYDSKTPLYAAAKNGHADCVLALLAVRPATQLNITNKSGRSPVFAAAKRGHTMVLRHLLAARADTSLIDSNAVSAIYIAAKSGHDECVSILVSHGANIDQILDQEDGCTALMRAAHSGDSDAVHILMQNDADTDARNPNHGATALHYAIISGDTESMGMLLESGVDTDAKIEISKPQFLNLFTSSSQQNRKNIEDFMDTYRSDVMTINPLELTQCFSHFYTQDILCEHFRSQRSNCCM